VLHRRRITLIAHERGHTRGLTDHGPGSVVHVHAHKHVARQKLALDQFLLAVLVLDGLLDGHDNLVDGVLDLKGLGAHLQVGLYLVFVAGVGLDDVPVARLLLQLAGVLAQAALVLAVGIGVCLGAGVALGGLDGVQVGLLDRLLHRALGCGVGATVALLVGGVTALGAGRVVVAAVQDRVGGRLHGRALVDHFLLVVLDCAFNVFVCLSHGCVSSSVETCAPQGTGAKIIPPSSASEAAGKVCAR